MTSFMLDAHTLIHKYA